MTTDKKNKLQEAGPKKKKMRKEPLTVDATVQFLFWRQAPPL